MPANDGKSAMRTRNLLLLIALFFSGWSTALWAFVPAQLSHASTSNFMLVASPRLTDPRFRGSVIVMTQWSEKGALGIILNHPRNIFLDRIYPEYPASKEIPLYAGGPVDPHQISFLVRGGGTVAGTLNISGHIYFSYDMSLLEKLLSGASPHTGMRVANGFSAWGPGQLEKEIARGDWFTLPIDEAVIFDHPLDGMWQELYLRADRPIEQK
ncbi:MAG: YqgE/AlgH family protein [Nitrosomonadales bacterium]|nr:YqgE/AlgH family protein [Nitrosomonadales bacterium]